MTRLVAKSRVQAKPAPSDSRNQNFRVGNQTPQISAVMQKVKGSLPRPNSAETLEFLTNGSLSTCQKLLSGHAVENGDMLRSMCRTHLAVDVVLGLVEDATDPVAVRLRKLVKRLKHEIEIEKLDAGVEE
ncbi:hypothetical protein RPMA_18435 [Tardiphaga alba]|uniref:Class II flagellar assembly regulator n=1 Tax=Tardiphaga alba TaxID=340268 RepID=A0ABX8AFL7_9BRAD|nr:hypothetical protein [Tardiphaga alba]QUS40595.1 hypothetical protein RPMA_18435 [Tardiphaga alba]